MKGLLAVLAKPKSGGGIASDLSPIGGGDEDDSDESFTEAAGQAMDALKAGDVDGFAEALKACIQMGG